MLKVTYKPYVAGQTLLILISVIVNLYLHLTIINETIYMLYIYRSCMDLSLKTVLTPHALLHTNINEGECLVKAG